MMGQCESVGVENYHFNKLEKHGTKKGMISIIIMDRISQNTSHLVDCIHFMNLDTVPV